MFNWRKTTLGNVAEVKLSNVDKKSNPQERTSRLCNYTDVYKNAFINADKATKFMIATCTSNEFENFKLRKGQVAITKDSETRDDIGVSTYIAEDFEDVVLGYHTSLITPNERHLNGKFLHYWLNTKQAKVYFENNAGGSGQRCTLPLDIIKAIPLYLPDISTQEKIAENLYCLDLKIDLNNRINAELEAIAKTLYDYWFVQFDFPNEEGKPYKSSGGKMVWSDELRREIPEGWEVKDLIDLTTMLARGISPKYIAENGISVLNQKCVRNKAIDFSFARRHDNDAKNAASKLIQTGDILVNSTGVGTLGRVAIVKRLEESLTTVDSHVTIVRIDPEKANRLFIGHSLLEKQEEIEKFGEGSTGQTELSRENLGNLKLIVPPKDLQLVFEDFYRPLVLKMANNETENKNLSQLRDWLLPMLMNGQVKVQ